MNERKEGRKKARKNERNCESNCDRSFIWIVFSHLTELLYIVYDIIFIKIDSHEPIHCCCICKWCFFSSRTHHNIIWCAIYAHIFYINSLFYVFSLLTSHIKKVFFSEYFSHTLCCCYKDDSCKNYHEPFDFNLRSNHKSLLKQCVHSRIKILSINILILKPWKEFFLCLPSIANRAHDYTLDNIFYFLINWMELKLISSWIYFVTQCFYNFLPSASIQGKQKLTRISLLLLFLSYCRCYSRRIKMICHFLAVAHTKLIFDLRWRKKREIIFSNNGVGLSVCLFCYIGCLDNCMAAKVPNLRLP